MIKHFCNKCNMGIKKRRISNSNTSGEKSYQLKSDRNGDFLTFFYFFNGFELTINFGVYDTHIQFLKNFGTCISWWRLPRSGTRPLLSLMHCTVSISECIWGGGGVVPGYQQILIMDKFSRSTQIGLLSIEHWEEGGCGSSLSPPMPFKDSLLSYFF